MPLNETEIRVLDLWDNGLLEPTIAQVTGCPLERVERIVTGYTEGCSATERARMINGSKRLRDAILAQPRPVVTRSKSPIWNTRSLAETNAQRGAVA